MLTRGASGYDAVLRWETSKAADLAGYAVVQRASTVDLGEGDLAPSAIGAMADSAIRFEKRSAQKHRLIAGTFLFSSGGREAAHDCRTRLGERNAAIGFSILRPV
jgi:hypothetical protein